MEPDPHNKRVMSVFGEFNTYEFSIILIWSKRQRHDTTRLVFVSQILGKSVRIPLAAVYAFILCLFCHLCMKRH